MYNKVVSVVGSWRPGEHEDNSEAEKNRFYAIAEMLGTLIHQDGHALRIVWSNDHLTDQCKPHIVAGKMRGEVLRDGRYKMKSSDVEYCMEATADYAALKGYIMAAKAHPRAGQQIELLISYEMWKGISGPETVSWKPVFAREIAGHPFEDYVNSGLIKLVRIDGGMKKPQYLRSLQLQDLVKGDNAVDAVFVLGGGKVTQLMCGLAMSALKLIPLPYCRGKGWDALMDGFYGNPRSHESVPESYGYLKRIFGNAPDTEKYYTSMDLVAIRGQLRGAITHFLSRPDVHNKGLEPPCLEQA